jgi:hypothetical protein
MAAVRGTTLGSDHPPDDPPQTSPAPTGLIPRSHPLLPRKDASGETEPGIETSVTVAGSGRIADDDSRARWAWVRVRDDPPTRANPVPAPDNGDAQNAASPSSPTRPRFSAPAASASRPAAHAARIVTRRLVLPGSPHVVSGHPDPAAVGDPEAVPLQPGRRVATRSMIEFIRGFRTPLRTTVIAASARIASNNAGYFPSRSRIKYVTGHPASSRSMSRFRAV